MGHPGEGHGVDHPTEVSVAQLAQEKAVVHRIVHREGLALEDLQEWFDVHREVVDNPTPAIGGEGEEPDAVPARIEAGRLQIEGDDLCLLDLGHDGFQALLGSDEGSIRIWLHLIVMSVITVMRCTIRLFYGVCTMTVICPFICAERHVIVITVMRGSGFPIGFLASMTIMTIMTVICRLILKEALLPLSARARQVLNLDALGPEHRGEAIEVAAEVLRLFGPGLVAADVLVHALAKLLEQFRGSTYPL